MGQHSDRHACHMLHTQRTRVRRNNLLDMSNNQDHKGWCVQVVSIVLLDSGTAKLLAPVGKVAIAPHMTCEELCRHCTMHLIH